MANQYITTSHDDFEKTSLTKSYELKYALSGDPSRNSRLSDSATVRISHVSNNDVEGLYITVTFTSYEYHVGSNSSLDSMYPGDWAFLRDGALIIIADDETFRLEPNGTDSDVKDVGKHDSAVIEICAYPIDKEILLKICESKNIRIQLKGSRGKWELGGEDFAFMAKAFYNGFYDDSKYCDELQRAQDKEKKEEEIDAAIAQKISQIKKRGWFVGIGLLVILIVLMCTVNDFGNSSLAGIIFGVLFVSVYYVTKYKIKKVLGKKQE
jgi:hypothetical protein